MQINLQKIKIEFDFKDNNLTVIYDTDSKEQNFSVDSEEDTLNTHRIWKPEIGELCYFWGEWGDESEYNHYPIIGTFKCIDKNIDYYICNEIPDDSFPVCTPYLGETFWC